MVHTHATRRCQIGLTIILVRLNRLRLVLQNPIGWLSQVFVARFDFIGVITRYKSENNFFTNFGERWIWQLRPHATNQKNVHSVMWLERLWYPYELEQTWNWNFLNPYDLLYQKLAEKIICIDVLKSYLLTSTAHLPNIGPNGLCWLAGNFYRTLIEIIFFYSFW